jgi:hypothetical protein
MTFTNYDIIVEPFAERHFIKSFRKKYKTAWDITEQALLQEFRVFDVLFQKSIVETITVRGVIKICKTEFKISGTQESRHGSGNRCIVAVHEDKAVIRILLVYHKNDIGGGNETATWKQIIRDNYPEYRSILTG